MRRQKKKKDREPQRYGWERRERRRMVNSRDIAGNTEEEGSEGFFSGRC